MNTERCPPPDWTTDSDDEIDAADGSLPRALESALGLVREPPALERIPDTKRTHQQDPISPSVARALAKIDWTLVADFEENGEHYIVARKNQT